MSEWTAEQWRNEAPRSARVRHECSAPAKCGVFRCRGKHGCGRIVGACLGGDGDATERVICSTCFVKYQRHKEPRP